jgi:hypothetical protein
MGRPSIHKKAMTAAQRQTRYRKRKQAVAKGAVKRERRELRMAAMVKRTEMAQLKLTATARIYNVIVLDPPWPFDVRNRATGLGRSHENHYQAMTLAEIEALVLPAAPDCVVALWATVPQMRNAYQLLAA